MVEYNARQGSKRYSVLRAVLKRLSTVIVIDIMSLSQRYSKYSKIKHRDIYKEK